MANRHVVRLDTERNCVELVLPDGTSEYYQPSYGSAADLYADLRSAAEDDPTTVLEFLRSVAEPVTPAEPTITVDEPDQPEPELPAQEAAALRSEAGEWDMHGTRADFDRYLQQYWPDAEPGPADFPLSGQQQWTVGRGRSVVAWWDADAQFGMVKNYEGEGVVGAAGRRNAQGQAVAPLDATVYGDNPNLSIA